MESSGAQSAAPQTIVAMWSCEECSVAFGNPHGLERHLRIHAEQAEQDRIERANMERENTETRNSYHCPHCAEIFQFMDHLAEHVLIHFVLNPEDLRQGENTCGRCLHKRRPCNGASPCGWCIREASIERCLPAASQGALEVAPEVTSNIAPREVPLEDPREGPLEAPHKVPLEAPREVPLESPREVPLEAPQMAPASAPASVAPSEAGSRQPSGSSTPTSDTSDPMEIAVVNGNMDEEDEDVEMTVTLDPYIRRNGASWLDFPVSSETHRGLDGQIAAGAGNNAATLGFSASIVLSSSQGPANTGPPEWPTSSNQISTASSAAMNGMWILFRESCIPPADSEQYRSLLPAIELLRYLVDQFFLGWHKVQPAFHPASWNFNRAPMELLGAMACIGSLMVGDRKTAHQISLRCIELLNLMVETLPPDSGSMGYLAAVCLHQTYLLGSADEHVHEYIFRVRAFVINNLAGRDLLGGSFPRYFTRLQNPSLQDAWIMFIKREQYNRVAWLAFEHDCVTGLIADQPHLVYPENLPPRLPCADALWDAPNAEAWAMLQSRSPYGFQGPPLLDVLNHAVSHTLLSEHISPWSKRLCAHIFERSLENVVRERKPCGFAQIFGLELGVDSSEGERTKLIWAMSFLGKSIEAHTPLSTADLVNSTSISLMRRYSHFTTRPRIMDLTIKLARLAASPSPPSSRTSLRLAQGELIEQLAENPYYSRENVWHAGQMFRITRDNVAFTPSDCLRIFMAYLFVLAFIKYGPPSLKDVPATEPFRVDAWPCSDNDAEMWLQAGGPVQLGSCTRIQPRCCTKQLMREVLQSLYRFQGWGVSERLYNILIHFNNLDVINES
ncbi:c2h2 type zinc finger domain-containing [Trichoderma arundinaceum]|uniref:C2h2 type zinc finger domain-containing n=1 Tax=Trichoderma arundinaceum TaxID=490622 RepID=A0A395N9H4_TRIAR|nr:c2h2 type zinc finger domain-containing [Trichoderma arundinaceum]